MNKRSVQSVRAVAYTLALWLVACGQEGVNPPQDEAPVKQPTGGQQGGTSIEQLIDNAKLNLANRTGFTVDEITVKQARSVTWGSSAAGCPEEGVGYTQSVVPGMLLYLQLRGTVYRYHGHDGNELFYCPDERATAPAYGQGSELM